MSSPADIRDTFVETIVEAAHSDPRVVAVVNDSVGSSRLAPFAERFADRFFNVGIAEQNMVGFSAGLAAIGLKPWACAATCFLSYRALEQIKNDIVYSDRGVCLVGNTSGVDYGALGATHHSLEDIGVLRALPGLNLFIPADHRETKEVTEWLLRNNGPAYLRLYRSAVPESLGMSGSFRPGRVRVLRTGSDCTIFAAGAMVVRALDAARRLERLGASVGVVNVSSLSPFDDRGVVEAATTGGRAVTVEEHMIQGGLGGAVCEVLARYTPMPVLRLGFDGAFATPGPPEEIRERQGLTGASIADRVYAFLDRGDVRGGIPPWNRSS